MTTTSRTTGNHTPRWGNWIVGIHLPLYRLTNGFIGHHLGHRRTLLLTTIGRRSGTPRTTPLTYMTDGPDYYVVASNWGSDQFPAWYYNLVAHPQVQVQIRTPAVPGDGGGCSPGGAGEVVGTTEDRWATISAPSGADAP